MPNKFAKLLKPYQGKWVALTEDETKVVGSGKTLKKAFKESLKNGHNDPVFMKVFPPDSLFIP